MLLEIPLHAWELISDQMLYPGLNAWFIRRGSVLARFLTNHWTVQGLFYKYMVVPDSLGNNILKWPLAF